MKTIQQIYRGQPQIQKKLKVAAYVRVSVESERMQHSLSAQISYYSGLIQKKPEWDYAGVYADYGISGTGIAKREAFKRMVADAEAGKIDIILTKAIQRFARNTVDLLNTVRHLKDISVEVWFEKEDIRTFSSDGELMLTILASFAQEESRSISENIRWRWKKKFEQGIPNSHFNIYGYRWEGDKLVIVPEEAKIVKRIYQNFLDGKSRLETEREFAAEGITTRRGKRWRDCGIKNILTNITYTGNLLLGKQFVEDPITKKKKKNHGEKPRYFVQDSHEAIIDKATFDAVQREMERRRTMGPNTWKKKSRDSFAGKIRCGHCGSFCVLTKRKRGYGYICRDRSCGAREFIPLAVLEQECAAVMGLPEFDKGQFQDQVGEIVIPAPKVLEFLMKDGRVITRHWVSTAVKVCWTEGRKERYKASMRKYMASGKGRRFSAFTTRIVCGLCGASYRRQTRPHADGGKTYYWRCSEVAKNHPSLHSLDEEALKKLSAEVLEIPSFDEAVFREKVDHISVGKDRDLTFYLTDGTTAVRPWTWKPPKQKWSALRRKNFEERRRRDAKNNNDTGLHQPVHSSTHRQ